MGASQAKGQLDVLHCKVHKTYDCELPDLRSLGGEYCASINFAYPFGEPTVEARKCGGKIGMTDFSFHVGGPPRFQGKSATVSKDGVLAWTDKEKGVYMVKLGPDWHTPKAPHLEIFTSETQIRWPDFEALGVTLPVGAKFRCQVSRLSPYASVDDLASWRGRGLSRSATDFQKVDSAPIEVTVEE